MFAGACETDLRLCSFVELCFYLVCIRSMKFTVCKETSNRIGDSHWLCASVWIDSFSLTLVRNTATLAVQAPEERHSSGAISHPSVYLSMATLADTNITLLFCPVHISSAGSMS